MSTRTSYEAINVTKFQRHAVADRPSILAAMFGTVIIANLWRRRHIKHVAALLNDPRAAGRRLFIVSVGFQNLSSCLTFMLLVR